MLFQTLMAAAAIALLSACSPTASRAALSEDQDISRRNFEQIEFSVNGQVSIEELTTVRDLVFSIYSKMERSSFIPSYPVKIRVLGSDYSRDGFWGDYSLGNGNWGLDVDRALDSEKLEAALMQRGLSSRDMEPTLEFEARGEVSLAEMIALRERIRAVYARMKDSSINPSYPAKIRVLGSDYSRDGFWGDYSLGNGNWGLDVDRALDSEKLEAALLSRATP